MQTFKGDLEYPIACTGDVVVGDEVKFTRSIFIYSSSQRKSTFSHTELVEGRVIRESYGSLKQQHTFTIQLPNGSTTLIKGRNLYHHGTWRKPWNDESERKERQHEKHKRGMLAREKKWQRLISERNW